MYNKDPSDALRVRAGGRPRKRSISPECKVGAGSVPLLPPPQQQQQLLQQALPAPAPAGAPVPAPRSTGSISAQPSFRSNFRPSPPAAVRGWSMGGAAAAALPLLNWSSSWGGGSWPQPAGGWQPATWHPPPAEAALQAPPVRWLLGPPPCPYENIPSFRVSDFSSVLSVFSICTLLYIYWVFSQCLVYVLF